MKGWTIVIDKDSLIAVPMYIDTDKKNYYPGTEKEIDFIDNYDIYEMVENPFYNEENMAKFSEIINERFLSLRAHFERLYCLDHPGELPNFTMERLRYIFFECIRETIGCSREKAYENWEEKQRNLNIKLNKV